MDIFLSGDGGGPKCQLMGEPKILGWGVLPLDGYWVWSPHPHTPPDIGQPWSNSLPDILSFGQVGGGHQSFRQCPVVQFSQLLPIHGEVGGVIIGRKKIFTFYMFLSI